MDSIIKIRVEKPKAKIETAIVLGKRMNPLKASYLSLSMPQRIGILICLLSLVTVLVPHETFASTIPQLSLTGPMVFAVTGQVPYVANLNLQLSKLYEHQTMQADLDRQIELGQKVQTYLQEQGSPLAQYATTLIQLDNWKKIISLANAESGLCRHYPVAKANCWGVGGPDLWYLGSNLKEGILSMNDFLNSYPAHSDVKYAQMSFKQMNGTYKQPPKQHWVDNNQQTYNDLTAIENSL